MGSLKFYVVDFEDIDDELLRIHSTAWRDWFNKWEKIKGKRIGADKK